MKSSVEVLSPTRVRLDVEVAYSELESHVAVAYKKVAAQVNIPGFRKGKIPAAMIDQRVGRGAVIDEAINSALPEFYGQAAREHKVAVIGRPEVDVKEFVDKDKLVFTVEVDVRPEVKLPDFSKITIEVDDVKVEDSDVDEQIESLRTRFGTLTTVEKDVEKGDFVTIDLSAKVDGAEIEGGSANGISYEVGSNRMVDGLDEALIGMKLEQVKKFNTQLVGMDEGQSGEVEVTLKAVKKRELPELNDEFAKLASEFETLAELDADVRQRLTRLKAMEQGAQARDNLLKLLLETVEIAVPENLVKEEVDAHLEKENRLEDSEHRSEVSLEITNSLKADFLLDTIVKSEAVQVSEAELTEYLIRSAARYQMSPDQFAQEISQAGQIHALMAEVARSKALAVVLERVGVKDASGRKVDLAALAPKQESGSEQ